MSLDYVFVLQAALYFLVCFVLAVLVTIGINKYMDYEYRRVLKNQKKNTHKRP